MFVGTKKYTHYKTLHNDYHWLYLPNNKVSFTEGNRISYVDKSVESAYSAYSDAYMTVRMNWDHSISDDMICLNIDFDNLEDVMKAKSMAKDLLTWTFEEKYVKYLLEGKGEITECSGGCEVRNSIYESVWTNIDDYILHLIRNANYPTAPYKRELYPYYSMELSLNCPEVIFVDAKDTTPHYENILKENNSRFDLNTLMNGSFLNDGEKYKKLIGEMASNKLRPKQIFTSEITYENVESENTDYERFVIMMEGNKDDDDFKYESNLKTEILRFPTEEGKSSFRIDGNFLIDDVSNEEEAIKEAIKVYVKLMNNLIPEGNFTEQEVIDTIYKEDAYQINAKLSKDLTFLGIVDNYSGGFKVSSYENDIYVASFFITR